MLLYVGESSCLPPMVAWEPLVTSPDEAAAAAAAVDGEEGAGEARGDILRMVTEHNGGGDGDLKRMVTEKGRGDLQKMVTVDDGDDDLQRIVTEEGGDYDLQRMVNEEGYGDLQRKVTGVVVTA